MRELIKIGVECSPVKLRCDLLAHPARYFFILVYDGRASLCIRTCDSQGEDIRAQAIDGLCVDSEGNVISVFEESLKCAARELESRKTHTSDGGEYPVTPHLERLISLMPDLVEWIVSLVLTKDRHIILYTSWTV